MPKDTQLMISGTNLASYFIKGGTPDKPNANIVIDASFNDSANSDLENAKDQVYNAFMTGGASMLKLDAVVDALKDSNSANISAINLYKDKSKEFYEKYFTDNDAEKLSNFVNEKCFGQYNDENAYNEVLSEFVKLFEVYSYKSDSAVISENNLKDVSIMETLFDIYGEPKWCWTDTKNPNDNGDAKAQWYTNLFNRMQQGYTTLEDGLASSNEWIQFAFESNLVTMEQVDLENNWVSITHNTCSDITEVTDDAAVAVAEAEYNRDMNAIENKDKRYDIELKNIDTEHNSLQQEYDSVKGVISKNIERSFKMYG